MDTKVKGIILKLTDYKEADKLASIFSLEEGLITAKFNGVKKDRAKYKAVAQPFCFADFVINKKQNIGTITSASVIDNFFLITSNYQKAMCAYVVVDILQSLLLKDNPEQEIFLLTISALKDIEQKDEFCSLINFILKFAFFSGVGVEFVEGENVYLDKDTGNFILQKSGYCVAIDKKVYKLILAINNGHAVELNPTTLKQAAKLMHTILFSKFGVEIKSFKYI